MWAAVFQLSLNMAQFQISWTALSITMDIKLLILFTAANTDVLSICSRILES